MNLQLPIEIFKNRLFQTCIIVKRTCISIFSHIGLVNQSKPCTQVYLQQFANCINLQLAIRISKNYAFRTCTAPYGHALPLTDIHAHFEINRPVRYPNTAKRNYFHRRTDGQTSRTTTMGSFFRKKNTKNDNQH